MMLGLATSTTGIAMISAPANAANLSYTGNLANPNDTPLFGFTADGTSTVTIQSSSWAAGGFDLALTLFDGSGNWKDERNDISAGNLDFRFNGILPAGTYQAVITAFGNYANGAFPGGKLSDGFANTGEFFGRTSAYAFDILNVNNATPVPPIPPTPVPPTPVPPTPSSVPEPSSIIGTVIAGFSIVMLKRRAGSKKK